MLIGRKRMCNLLRPTRKIREQYFGQATSGTVTVSSGILIIIHSFIHSFIHPFIHSFRSLPCDWSINFSKPSSLESAIQCVLLRIPVSSVVLQVIQQLLTPSYLSSRPFQISFCISLNNVFQKALPTHDLTNRISLALFLFVQDVPFFFDSM